MGKTTTTTSVAAAAAEIKPRHTDKQIWGLYVAFLIVSIIELFSASSNEVTPVHSVFAPVIRHFMFLLVGFGIMLYLQNVHYSHFLKWSYVFAGFSVIFMIYTLFCGEYINGARRSFSFFGLFMLQPAEMVKISAVLIIAALLSRTQLKSGNDVTMKGLIQVTVCVMAACALLVSQGLTNTLLLVAISMSMMLIGGVGFKKLGLVLLAFMVSGAIGIGAKMALSHLRTAEAAVQATEIVVPGTDIVLGIDPEAAALANTGRESTWKARLKRHFMDNKFDEKIDDKNQQEQYSYMAQAHGGIFGVLPGNSRETARLPLAFSDYIYAIIIEELGLIGGIAVLLMYLWLLARAGRIATRCRTAYPAYLVIGMAVFITFQAIFHMSIVSGVFPVSGQPLPLISKGGTSILITSVALGVMLSVSRFAARKDSEEAEIKDELKALAPEVSAVNPT